MRKILFTLGVVAAAITLQAQSIEIGNESPDLVEGTLDAWELTATVYVTNISDSNLEFGARRTVISEPEGTANRFCWGITCFDSNTDDSGDSQDLWLQPGESDNSLKAYYNPYEIAGDCVVEYCVYEIENPEIASCHTVTYRVDNTFSIDEVQLAGELTGFNPNPISDVSSFGYNLTKAASDSKIEVYNMLGAKIKTVVIEGTSGVVFVNADEFETGLYFYALYAEGKVLQTKRFAVQ